MTKHEHEPTDDSRAEQIWLISVVTAQANSWATDQLREHALTVLAAAPNVQVREASVPGCFELPVACAAAVRDGADGVLALGAIISDGTPHGSYLATAVCGALASLSMTATTPIAFGVLTVDTDAEALDRVGTPLSRWDKGSDAAHALLTTLRNIPPMKLTPGQEAAA